MRIHRPRGVRSAIASPCPTSIMCSSSAAHSNRGERPPDDRGERRRPQRRERAPDSDSRTRRRPPACTSPQARATPNEGTTSSDAYGTRAAVAATVSSSQHHWRRGIGHEALDRGHRRTREREKQRGLQHGDDRSRDEIRDRRDETQPPEVPRDERPGHERRDARRQRAPARIWPRHWPRCRTIHRRASAPLATRPAMPNTRQLPARDRGRSAERGAGRRRRSPATPTATCCAGPCARAR